MKNNKTKVILTIELIAAALFTVASVVTTIKTGARFPYGAMTIVFAALAVAFDSYKKDAKKEKEDLSEENN